MTLQSLSSHLTKTAAYRRTICKVSAEAYLLRRIRGDLHPLQSRLANVQDATLEVATTLISELDWQDVENLVDLTFAWVQVKAASNQNELNDYLDRFEADGSCDRFFFICGNASARLRLPTGHSGRLTLWHGRDLAERAVATGLMGWLCDWIS